MLIKFSESRGGHIFEGGMEGGAYLKGLSFSFFKFWPQNNIYCLIASTCKTNSKCKQDCNFKKKTKSACYHFFINPGFSNVPHFKFS